MIKSGNYTFPLNYAIDLYKSKNFVQTFNYFELLSEINHPVAIFYIGVMKYKGHGCFKNNH